MITYTVRLGRRHKTTITAPDTLAAMAAACRKYRTRFGEWPDSPVEIIAPSPPAPSAVSPMHHTNQESQPCNPANSTPQTTPSSTPSADHCPPPSRH